MEENSDLNKDFEKIISNQLRDIVKKLGRPNRPGSDPATGEQYEVVTIEDATKSIRRINELRREWREATDGAIQGE